MNKIPIIVIVGPTASGKTALAVEVSKRHNGEVISADSMQIYKGMDIATAKPTEEEKQKIIHHLISIIDNDKSFSVADYLKLAREKIKEVNSRGKLPVIVGGTGLYISSLVNNIEFEESNSNSEVRKRLTAEMNEKGALYMLEKLKQIDSETAETLHENNKLRIIRALEVYEVTGKTMNEQKILSKRNESPYDACMIGLNYENREDLYTRINKRVDIMVERGLIEEAREIYENKKLKTACQAIGYKELIPYFNRESELCECIDNLKKETRHYAKRQLTWFRRDERINWIILDRTDNSENGKKIIINCEKIIANFGKV